MQFWGYPGPIRSLVNSLPGPIIPWPFRSLELSLRGPFAPDVLLAPCHRPIYTIGYSCKDYSINRVTRRPGSERARERRFQGARGPGSE